MYKHHDIQSFRDLQRFCKMRLKPIFPAYSILEGSIDAEADLSLHGISDYDLIATQGYLASDLLDIFHPDLKVKIMSLKPTCEEDINGATQIWEWLAQIETCNPEQTKISQDPKI